MARKWKREEIDRHNPFRGPAWRRDRVRELIEREPCPGRPCSQRDDDWICSYHRMLRRVGGSVAEAAEAALPRDLRPVYQADRWYATAGHGRRNVLEARLLAREADADIARQTGLLPDAVAWYERLFYNVRDRLHARTWIIKAIRGSRRRLTLSSSEPLSEWERGEFFRSVAYFGGSLALDFALQHLADPERDPGDQVPDWDDDSPSSRLVLLAALAVREPDQASAVPLLRAHAKLLREASGCAPGRAAAARQASPEVLLRETARLVRAA